MTQYGLIGHPLGHSFSRGFFTEKFAREGIDAEYLNFDIADANQLRDIISGHPQLRGLNVTIPHKQAVIPLLDDIDSEAFAIGAVNVIRVTRDADGRPHLKGYNADVIGFCNSIRPLLGPHHRHALVLGTGGASKAVVHGLHALGLTTTYVSRTPSEDRLTYGDITADIIRENTVIVNTTPLGMSPKVDACPDIPYTLLSPDHLLYDLVYNPEETRFLRNGRLQGAITKNGLEMLHLQALASWRFWHEETP